MQRTSAKHARLNAPPSRKERGARFALFAATLFIMSCALYSRFLYGNDSFVFVDVGADSWSQSVPFFLNAAERFAQFDFSTWDFAQFLGTQTIQAVNPEYLASAFGAQRVGPMMLVSHLVKVWLTGIFFYLFTSYWNLRYTVRFVSSLGMAFCGRMIAVAAWTGYTMEVMLAACLLWAFERFLADARKFIALPIGFALMIAALGLYGTVLYSFVMLVYVAFRLGYGEHRLKSGREVGIFLVQLICLYIAGILLIAVTLFPAIEGYFDSARVASNTEGAVLPQTVPLEIYAAETLSLFTPSAMGSMIDYAGPCNTLNNPYFYCGVAALLGVPFAFRSKSKRQRIWLGLFAGITLVYILSASFRYILNGFGVPAADFRMSSFWVTITLAVLGMLGLNELFKGARPLPIIITCIVYLVLLAAACFILQDYVRKPWVALAVACLIAYAIIILAASKWGISTPLCVLFVVICVIELLGQSWVMANNVSIASKDKYNDEYNTDFPALIDELDGNDDDLYRIDWKTGLLARPMAYNYRGTQAYVGGAGYSKAQMEFMSNVAGNDYVEQMGYSRYMYGFYDNALNTLLGVRYLVYDLRGRHEEVSYYVPYGYREIEHGLGGFRIYENGNALPFMMSYGYDEAQSSEQLLALPRSDRASAMFERCVVPDDHAHATTPSEGLFPHAEAPVIAKSDATLTGDGEIDLTFAASNEPYLVLEMTVNSKSSESLYANLEIALTDESTDHSITIPYLVPTGNEDIAIPVPNEGYTKAKVRFTQYPDLKEPLVLSGFTVKEAPNSYFERYDAACQDKLAEKPSMSVATNDRVACSIDVADDGYIATSVPWSKSWHAYIDGTEVSTFPINFGFVGMETPAGHHDIELVYRDTPREMGGPISFATLIGLILTRVIVELIARRRKETGSGHRSQTRS